MLVATVTAPGCPAWAMISASRKCCLALRTSWSMPRLSSSRESFSDLSTDTVPTKTGWPAPCRFTMSSTRAENFPSSVL